MKSGVACRAPLTITKNRWPTILSVTGTKRRNQRMIAFSSGSTGFSDPNIIWRPV
jgi:hypothetical protein